MLFRFLTEPKEVRQSWRDVPVQLWPETEQRFLTALSLEQVERFLTQLSDFATMNKISLGPLKNIVKSILLVPNGK